MSFDSIDSIKGFSSKEVDRLRYSSTVTSRYESVGLIMKRIKRNSRMLDIGCGTGSISKTIADGTESNLLGLEPDEKRAEAARDRGLEVLTAIYSDEIGEKYGPFDVILFADVLEHLVDPASLIEKVKKSLGPDGIIIASIPNVAHWTVRVKLLFGVFDYKPTGIMDATHLRWFTRKGTRTLFEVAGYDIISFDGAAGGWMSEYQKTPLRFLKQESRSAVLSKLCRFFPGLFSVQHIVSAKVQVIRELPVPKSNS